MKILLVEDDRELLKTVLKYFDSFGYNLDPAKSFKDAKGKIKDSDYDCAIVDINLPDGNGLDLIEIIKAKDSSTGVLILSANGNLEDRLHGFDIGADDYLTKPFHLSELNARLKSIVRRNKFQGKSILDFNEITIDTDAKEVFVHENKLKLTKKEYDLLVFFVTNKNKVITKQSISNYIWGDYIELSDSYDFIYTHLKNLRKKIIQNGGNDYVKSVYGLGYKFTDIEV